MKKGGRGPRAAAATRDADEAELVACKHLLIKVVREHIDEVSHWECALKAVEADTDRIDWQRAIQAATTDLHEAAMLSALSFAAAFAVRRRMVDVESPEGDVCFLLRMVEPREEGAGAVFHEFDARVDSQTKGGQLLLRVALDAGNAAYLAMERQFGAPGGALWIRHLSGRRQLMNEKREGEVSLALLTASTDAEAFNLAGVSTAAGNRIKRRRGLSRKRTSSAN